MRVAAVVKGVVLLAKQVVAMYCNHSLNCTSTCQSSLCSQCSTYWRSSNLPRDRMCSKHIH